jgi:hypothetical protein
MIRMRPPIITYLEHFPPPDNLLHGSVSERELVFVIRIDEEAFFKMSFTFTSLRKDSSILSNTTVIIEDKRLI